MKIIVVHDDVGHIHALTVLKEGIRQDPTQPARIEMVPPKGMSVTEIELHDCEFPEGKMPEPIVGDYQVRRQDAKSPARLIRRVAQ